MEVSRQLLEVKFFYEQFLAKQSLAALNKKVFDLFRRILLGRAQPVIPQNLY